MRNFFTGLLIFLSIFLHSQLRAEIQLPSLGDAGSAVISLEQERALGQAWLRSFRAGTDLERDYLLQEYVENLLFSMVRYSAMEDKRLDVLIVDNPTLNAFAVPGGIVGVHTGLFNYAETEDQFSSVMAHELSHLSQRHFARSVAANRKNSTASLAGLLAGVILAATVGGDAGLAALSATQAAALEASLKYSRQNEQEADRIGMSVLVEAGYDPQGMADMFENMLKATRYVGYQAPEYLRTHPLTETRVNDAQLRARRYPQRHIPTTGTYQLMRTRVDVRNSGSPDQAVRKYEALRERSPEDPAVIYGLALAYQNALQLDEARALGRQLCKAYPQNQVYAIFCADLHDLFGESELSRQLLESHLQLNPNSYSLKMALANNKAQAAEFGQASVLLRQLTIERPNDVNVWYEYAETLGLAGNISELHKARAEYFVLVGAYERAIRQLQFAKKEARGNAIEMAILDEKISRAAKLRSDSQF